MAKFVRCYVARDVEIVSLVSTCSRRFPCEVEDPRADYYDELKLFTYKATIKIRDYRGFTIGFE